MVSTGEEENSGEVDLAINRVTRGIHSPVTDGEKERERELHGTFSNEERGKTKDLGRGFGAF